MRYCLIDTELGTFGLAWTDAGVARVALPGADRATAADRVRAGGAQLATPGGVLQDLPGRIVAYARGARDGFDDVPLDLAGTAEFHQRAYRELMQVGYGETTTYGAIARALGDVTLARAVGQAMGANRIPLLIPCHRVMGAGDRTVGFSAPGGVVSKMRLLALEHAAGPSGQYAFGF